MSEPKITPDGYEIVPYNPHTPTQQVVGRQCGKCGLKVQFGLTMGYCCGSVDCPMGFGPLAFSSSSRGL